MTGMVRDGRYMDVGNPGYRMLSGWLWLRPARRAIMVPARAAAHGKIRTFSEETISAIINRGIKKPGVIT